MAARIVTQPSQYVYVSNAVYLLSFILAIATFAFIEYPHDILRAVHWASLASFIFIVLYSLVWLFVYFPAYMLLADARLVRLFCQIGMAFAWSYGGYLFSRFGDHRFISFYAYGDVMIDNGRVTEHGLHVYQDQLSRDVQICLLAIVFITVLSLGPRLLRSFFRRGSGSEEKAT